MNIKNAIIQFLANEFHMEADNINEDTSFETDFGLNSDQIVELLQKLEDSLNIELPEDQTPDITTVGNLLESIESEEGEELA
jgi:acyl carrier protein